MQQGVMLHSLFYLEATVHVLGSTITHHQECKQLYLQHLVFVTPFLLSATIMEELELVWVCCGWHTDLFCFDVVADVTPYFTWPLTPYLRQQPHQNKTDQYATHSTLKPVPTLPQ
jgi:hypothetical protein